MNTPHYASFQYNHPSRSPVLVIQRPYLAYVRDQPRDYGGPIIDPIPYYLSGQTRNHHPERTCLPREIRPRFTIPRPIPDRNLEFNWEYEGEVSPKNYNNCTLSGPSHQHAYIREGNSLFYHNRRQFGLSCLNLRNDLSAERIPEEAPRRASDTPLSTGTPGANDATNSKKVVKLPTGCTGIINLGNTCYMNSVLQCLSHTKFLVDYCFDQKSKQNSKSKSQGIVADALAEVFRSLWSGQRCYDPTHFRRKLLSSMNAFEDVTCQEDAQEFLLFLLGSLHEDLKKKDLKKKHQSIRLYNQCDKRADNAWKAYLGSEKGVVVDIFMGQQRSSLTCSSCGHVSHTFEPAQGISLAIPKSDCGSEVTLHDCLSHYFHNETLRGDEKPACSICRQKSDAKKCLKMQKFPKIFVIQLNRFSNDANGATKITTPVSYPISNLNFKEFAYVDANVIYNLYAVVDHIGELDNGHYVAIIRNRVNGQWYHYDDDFVQPIDKQLVVRQSAYILFYELHSAEKEKSGFASTFGLKNLFN